MQLLAAQLHKGSLRLATVTVKRVDLHPFSFAIASSEDEEGCSWEGLPILHPGTAEVVGVRLQEASTAALFGVFLQKLEKRKQLDSALDQANRHICPKPIQVKKMPLVSNQSLDQKTLDSATKASEKTISEMTVRPQNDSSQRSVLDSTGMLIAVCVLFASTGMYILLRLFD